jgi:hypothetical protein
LSVTKLHFEEEILWKFRSFVYNIMNFSRGWILHKAFFQIPRSTVTCLITLVGPHGVISTPPSGPTPSQSSDNGLFTFEVSPSTQVCAFDKHLKIKFIFGGTRFCYMKIFSRFGRLAFSGNKITLDGNILMTWRPTFLEQ